MSGTSERCQHSSICTTRKPCSLDQSKSSAAYPVARIPIWATRAQSSRPSSTALRNPVRLSWGVGRVQSVSLSRSSMVMLRRVGSMVTPGGVVVIVMVMDSLGSRWVSSSAHSSMLAQRGLWG